MYDEPTIPCKLCTEPTRMLATKLCDHCWHMNYYKDRWLPMETAPKDGTEVLMKEDGSAYITYIYNGRWAIKYSDYYLCAPEGWRPLPEV